MISGFATDDGTARFAQKCNTAETALLQNYKKSNGLTLSNIGIGTYLGEPDSKTDSLVVDAIKESVQMGVNVIDTAINYRAQKAERCVGKAISDMINDNNVRRDELFVSTKNGYVTNDAEVDLEFWAFVKKEYTEKGIIQEGEVSSGYHCMSVKYLEDQLRRSLDNLGLECIDLLYLHNAVEGQIKDVTRKDFIKKLKAVFEMYEQKRKEGKIRYYGMATWESFRVKSDDPRYLSLDTVLELARDAAGPNNEHGFRFIQLPFNMYYDQALLLKNHVLNQQPATVLQAAVAHGVGVFSSVPLMQGRLLQSGVMPEFVGKDQNSNNKMLPANLRALQFIRSTPGILTPLVGQKQKSHVQQNLEIMKMAPLDRDEFAGILKKLVGS